MLTISTPSADEGAVLDTLHRVDRLAAAGDRDRRDELREALRTGRLRCAWLGSAVVGYSVLAPWWFGADFLQLLYVDVAHRRSGVGRLLLDDAQGSVAGRIFTSTNRSNVAMQRLVESCGWRRCGWLEGLDEGDPELFYRTG